MHGRIFIAALFFVLSASLQAQQFEMLRANQSITLVLPAAQCEAKVISRSPDQLTLLLKRTTPCGVGRTSVTLARKDLDHIVDERPPGRRANASISPAGYCTIAGTILVAISAGQYLGETNRGGAALAAIAGGGVASVNLCYLVLFRRPPRVTVFASRITPTPAKAS